MYKMPDPLTVDAARALMKDRRYQDKSHPEYADYVRFVTDAFQRLYPEPEKKTIRIGPVTAEPDTIIPDTPSPQVAQARGTATRTANHWPDPVSPGEPDPGHNRPRWPGSPANRVDPNYRDRLAEFETFPQARRNTKDYRDPYQVVNREGGSMGALGKYGARKPVPQDAEIVDERGNWTGKVYDGAPIRSEQGFRDNDRAQEETFAGSTANNGKSMKNLGILGKDGMPSEKYRDRAIQTPEGSTPIGEAGLHAAAHFAGVGVLTARGTERLAEWSRRHSEGRKNHGERRRSRTVARRYRTPAPCVHGVGSGVALLMPQFRRNCRANLAVLTLLHIRGKAMQRVYVILGMLAAMLALPALAAEYTGGAVFNKTYRGAKDRIVLYPNNFGAEAEFIHTFLNMGNSLGKDKFIDPRQVFVGRFDLNGDGVPELFVSDVIVPRCLRGCEIDVFQLVDGLWVEVGVVSARFGAPPQTSSRGHVSRDFKIPPDPIWLFASDERVDGWRTLLDYGWRYRWVPGTCTLHWGTADGCYDVTKFPEKELDLQVQYDPKTMKNMKLK